MAKFLRVTMPDMSKYDVPADIIAKNRATYYAAREVEEASELEFDKEFQEEYQYAMNDDFELVDWAANNMDWADVEPHAIKVPDQEDFDIQSAWVNGKKVIVER